MKNSMKLGLLTFAVLGFIAMPVLSDATGNAENGKKIYEKRCWWCHGEEGAGDGPASDFLNPPPRSFQDAVYKFKSTQGEDLPTDDDLFKIISNGMSGTAMPSWEDMLSESDRHDVIAYIKGLGEGMFEESEFKPVDYSGEVPSSDESIAKGKDLFHNKAGCNECHGEYGRGNGMKALKDDIFNKRVWPRNLTQPWTFRAGSAPRDIYTRITTGIPGTPMPSFAKNAKGNKTMTNEERWNVANYVVSLADNSNKLRKGVKVLKSVQVDQVPSEIKDEKWKAAEGLVVPLVPQIIAKERFFTPTNNGVLLKSVFDKDKIAFLLEWDDRTASVVGDPVVEKLSEGMELNPDAVALQLPQTIPDSLQKPYFGHGDKEKGVNILYWNAGSLDRRDAVALYDANGHGAKTERPADKSGFHARGEYKDGTWKVLMTRRLKTDEGTDLQFEEGKFIPLAVANWDGSNLEKGSKHTMTTWYWLLMEPSIGNEIYVYPGVVAFILIFLQFLYARSQRREFS